MEFVKFKKFILSNNKQMFINLSEKDDFKELREYIPGEDIRNIHWFSTAKKNKPMVIERESRKSQNILLVLLLDKNSLFLDKLPTMLKIYFILATSAIYQKQNLEILIVTDTTKLFKVTHLYELNEVENYINSLDLKKVTLAKFNITQKRYLVVFIGDFFYKIDFNLANKNVFIFVREKIEENPKKYLNYTLKDISSNTTFLTKLNLKYYLSKLKQNDSYYQNFKIIKQKIYPKDNIVTKLKEVLE